MAPTPATWLSRDSARRLGYVGAWSFALGVGTVIAGQSGNAVADTGSPDRTSSVSVTHSAIGHPSTSSRDAQPIKQRGLAQSQRIRLQSDITPPQLARAQRAAAQPGHTIGSLFFAATPVIAYNAAQNVQNSDGTITGTLNASQANGYALTYTTTAPQHGSVEIHDDGTFTYTPNEAFATTGGTDTFTVTADDEPGNPPHWHGPLSLFVPNYGSTATSMVTVLENPGSPEPNSVLATTDQLAAEKLATEIANSLPVQLAKVILKLGWLFAGATNFARAGGVDEENLLQLDQAVTEYATQAAMEVQLLDSNAPKIIQQVAPTHDWYMQSFAGTRIWYDNPDTIYRFVGVNNASSYVITGNLNGAEPADTNISVLTGLTGATAANINGRELVVNEDGSFTITANSSPAAPGQVNHLQLPPGTTLITTRNTLSDWSTQEPMTLSVLRVSGPPDSLFSQIGGFAIPFIGPLVSSSPVLTSLVSLIPPLPGNFVKSIETAVIMLFLGISGENEYMQVATRDVATGKPKQPNVFTDPQHNASFLATQLQSAGYFQLADDEALILSIDPGKAQYFSVPVTNVWTITNNYWDEQTSLNVSQSIANPDGSYTIVVSPSDPGVANWVSTGGLNQGTISIRFQDFDPLSTVDPTVSSQVVPLSQLVDYLPNTTVYVTPEERRTQITTRQLGYNKRYTPYPQA